jgi:H+/Cl- antiporter ClcA
VRTIIDSVFVTTLSGWLGSAVFFSAVILPTLFINLEPAAAGEIAALIFPFYYRFGLACGLLLLVACVVAARRETATAGTVRGRWWAAVATVALMLLCQAYAEFVIRPDMSEIRGLADAKPAFDALHRLSVRLNAVVLAGGLALAAGSGLLLGRRGAG